MSKNIYTFENYHLDNNYEQKPTTSETIKRLKSPEVYYMEMYESKFRCHDCHYYEHDYCENTKVQSKVWDDGCCNLYTPKIGDAIDSTEWHVY